MIDLYNRVLEQNPDPDGLFNYGKRLQTGELSTRMAVKEIGKSGEYFSKFVQHPVVPRSAVIFFYNHFLARDPESEEVITEHIALMNTKGWKHIVDKLVDSKEYLSRFGEHSVPA